MCWELVVCWRKSLVDSISELTLPLLRGLIVAWHTGASITSFSPSYTNYSTGCCQERSNFLDSLQISSSIANKRPLIHVISDISVLVYLICTLEGNSLIYTYIKDRFYFLIYQLPAAPVQCVDAFKVTNFLRKRSLARSILPEHVKGRWLADHYSQLLLVSFTLPDLYKLLHSSCICRRIACILSSLLLLEKTIPVCSRQDPRRDRQTPRKWPS